MRDQRVRISLSDLPARARQLTDAQLQNVFGGCEGYGMTCRGDLDCCSGNCQPAPHQGRCMH